MGERVTMTGANATDRPYIVVSSDSHAGPRWADYRPYLDPQHRVPFESWLESVTAPDVLIGGTRVDTRGKTIRDAFANEQAVRDGGVAGAWDPSVRAREMDRDGVAAEVVFPD